VRSGNPSPGSGAAGAAGHGTTEAGGVDKSGTQQPSRDDRGNRCPDVAYPPQDGTVDGDGELGSRSDVSPTDNAKNARADSGDRGGPDSQEPNRRGPKARSPSKRCDEWSV